MRSRNTLLWLVFTVLAVMTPVQAQGEAAGGKITQPPAGSKESTKPPRGRSSATLDRIDGKWWTTGNGFGDSEVVFTQNGSQIKGVIRYADGRTGTISGMLVGKRLQHTWSNSSGIGGSGWLELSWANFLGGPWRNPQIKDGSWTMSRVEGKWCFNGQRNRVRTVTHDATGRLTIFSEDGNETGRLEGPWIYLDSVRGNIKGDRHYKGNRIDWADGTYWTWCGR
ncbi:MAG TPA: hypothetical protein VMM84_10510 [Pyrinomonadaceae bacterium]|nr:hypothetical protein [Pyrinomonadaceae bacterium]